MSDEQLIEYISQIWVENGGDSIGFETLYSKILEAIKDKE